MKKKFEFNYDGRHCGRKYIQCHVKSNDLEDFKEALIRLKCSLTEQIDELDDLRDLVEECEDE